MTLTTGSGDRARVAVHEAGHAVAVVMVGARVRHLSIERADGLAGWCEHDSVGVRSRSPQRPIPTKRAERVLMVGDPRERIRDRRASAAIAAGGIAGELLEYGEYDPRRADQDLRALRGYFDGDDVEVSRVVDSVRTALGAREARGALTVVASLLLKEGALSGERVHRVCELYDVQPDGLRSGHPARSSPASSADPGRPVALFEYPRPQAKVVRVGYSYYLPALHGLGIRS